MINQLDLLLVPFPFSDQSGKKVRSVAVISNDEFNKNSEDILVVGITSNISKDKYALPLTSKDLESGKLNTPCCIKVENILRLDKELMIKKIGKIQKNKLSKIMGILINICKSN